MNDHVQEEEINRPPMIDYLFDDLILAAFGNESGDGGTEKSLSIAQKVERKLMDMAKIKKGLTVDSGAADHVMPIGWLFMALVMKSIGSIRGLHDVASDGTRIPNVGQQLIAFMTRRDVDRAPGPDRGDQQAHPECVEVQRGGRQGGLRREQFLYYAQEDEKGH